MLQLIEEYKKSTIPRAQTARDMVKKYKKSYPDQWVFAIMKTGNNHQYMAYNDQKAYTKAYFVPYLQLIEKGTQENKKNLLLKDIRRNIQDETGIKQDIKWEDWEDQHPSCPTGEKLSKYYRYYKDKAHSVRRKDALQGKRKLYKKWLEETKQKHYQYTNTNNKNDPLHNGTIRHTELTQQVIKTHNRYNILGRVYFLEHTIPIEYSQSLARGKRLYPNMSTKVAHYEKDHIIHDAQAHAKRLDQAIEASNFNKEENEEIKKGIYQMALIRAIRYQWCFEQFTTLGKS